MKIDLKYVLKALDGKGELKDTDQSPLTIGKALARIVMASKIKKYDPLKAYVLMQRFYEGEDGELDTADYNNLKEVIAADEAYNPLVDGQIMQILAKEGEPTKGKK